MRPYVLCSGIGEAVIRRVATCGDRKCSGGCTGTHPPKLRRSVKTVGRGASPVNMAHHMDLALQGLAAQAVGIMVDVVAIYHSQLRLSSSASHRRELASEGIRQSPRGDRQMLPTFGPSGKHDLLNCWAKNRR